MQGLHLAESKKEALSRHADEPASRFPPHSALLLHIHGHSTSHPFGAAARAPLHVKAGAELVPQSGALQVRPCTSRSLSSTPSPLPPSTMPFERTDAPRFAYLPARSLGRPPAHLSPCSCRKLLFSEAPGRHSSRTRTGSSRSQPKRSLHFFRLAMAITKTRPYTYAIGTDTLLLVFLLKKVRRRLDSSWRRNLFVNKLRIL